ncbi:hypothetical protein ARSQ2_02227 [Arsenophonus endosymbiont of Bemisia tabaci Q2]|nr:hypothetical protein ARSQ2_02227 [Arsenophonus endosymbiont of Bemisia tabaci Q2]
MLLFDSRFSCLKSLMENYGHIKKKTHFGGYCILVNHVIIGQVLDSEFYLRDCLFAELQFEVSGLQKLIYTKKGVPLILKYFLSMKCFGMIIYFYVITLISLIKRPWKSYVRNSIHISGSKTYQI